jgi:hypothetical protein
MERLTEESDIDSGENVLTGGLLMDKSMWATYIADVMDRPEPGSRCVAHHSVDELNGGPVTVRDGEGRIIATDCSASPSSILMMVRTTPNRQGMRLAGITGSRARRLESGPL